MKAKLKNWPRKYVAKPDGVVWVTASDEIYLSRATLYPGHAVQTSRKQSEAIKFTADTPAARDLIRVVVGIFGCRLVRLKKADAVDPHRYSDLPDEWKIGERVPGFVSSVSFGLSDEHPLENWRFDPAKAPSREEILESAKEAVNERPWLNKRRRAR